LALLELFRRRAPDAETNAWVITLATDRNNWPGAHDLFRPDSSARPAGMRRTSKRAIASDVAVHLRGAVPQDTLQETRSRAHLIRVPRSSSLSLPFRLARAIGVPVPDVLASVGMQANPETAIYRRVFPKYPGPAAATSVPGRSAQSKRCDRVPRPSAVPINPPGPYERNMGDRLPDFLAFSRVVCGRHEQRHRAELAVTRTAASAGHALFDIVNDRLLMAMRARDQLRYLQHELEWSCLQALYNATSPCIRLLRARRSGSPERPQACERCWYA